jgi:hypothetical protein
LFTALAEALEWIVRKRGLSWLLKYIDDFLTMGKAGTNECSHNLQVFKDVCAELCLPLKDEKTVNPTTVLDFLGII